MPNTKTAAVGAESTLSDWERLQGAWRFLCGKHPADLTIDGERFTIRFRVGYEYRGTFALSVRRGPHRIDMSVEDGPEQHKGQTFQGIYELIGTRMLRLCPGRTCGPRVTQFPGDTQEGLFTLVFHREHPSTPEFDLED